MSGGIWCRVLIGWIRVVIICRDGMIMIMICFYEQTNILYSEKVGKWVGRGEGEISWEIDSEARVASLIISHTKQRSFRLPSTFG